MFKLRRTSASLSKYVLYTHSARLLQRYRILEGILVLGL